MASHIAAIQEQYGSIADHIIERQGSETQGGCCAPVSSVDLHHDPITRDLYDPVEVEGIPNHAVQASLGCGNPTAMVEILPGQTVLDLGSGFLVLHCFQG